MDEQHGPKAPAVAPKRPRSARGGRPPVHGLKTMRKALGVLTTERLDGRSKVAVAVRQWKADVRADLGDDLTRAQETLLEHAARAWVILGALDDWLMRQPSLVTRKRAVVPVVMQRMQIADSLGRTLGQLGLGRVARDVPSLDAYLAQQKQEQT